MIFYIEYRDIDFIIWIFDVLCKIHWCFLMHFTFEKILKQPAQLEIDKTGFKVIIYR